MFGITWILNKVREHGVQVEALFMFTNINVTLHHEPLRMRFRGFLILNAEYLTGI